MLGNSSQHPEFGHFTLECALNSSFHWFMRERGMSRRAWFSAFGRPFFFPSVLSLAGLSGSKQSGAWLGTICPPRATGSPSFGGSCRTGSRTSFRLPSFPGPLLLDPGSRRPPPTPKGSVITAEQVDRPVRPTRAHSGLEMAALVPYPQTGLLSGHGQGGLSAVLLVTGKAGDRGLLV